MDVDGFLARAPEFRTYRTVGVPGGDARIQAALDSATRRTSAAVFGDDTDDAIFFLAAHLLAASPTGKDARLKGGDFVSLYLEERHRLESIYAPLVGTNAGAPDVSACDWSDGW